MIVSIVAAVVAAAAFALVGYPLLQDRRRVPALAPDPREVAVADLQVQREAAYAAIKELEFDYEMGNLIAADYQEVRGRLRQKAAGILRDLDVLQSQPGSRAAEVERAPSPTDDIELAVQLERQRRRSGRLRPRCPACGNVLQPEDQFCSECGTPVKSRCPSCGAPWSANDRFCAGCGKALVEVMG